MTYQYERKYPLQCPFLRVTDLKTGEARLLKVGRDVIWRDERLYISVKEVRWQEQVHIAERLVPVISGQEQAVLRLVEGRAPEERMFRDLALRVPPRRVVYALRRHYGRTLYLTYDPGRKLPGSGKRELLSPRDYDEEAARKGAIAMGRPTADPTDSRHSFVL